jgi:uncharacterized protein
MRRLVLRLWDAWFGREVAEVEAAAERFRTSAAGKRPDWKTVWVLVTAAAALTGQNFWHQFVPIFELADRFGVPWELAGLLAFAVGCVFWYVVPAAVLVKFAFRERLTDYGVKLAGWSSGWKIYIVFVAVMVPLVLVFSAEPTFQRIYPFYRGWTPADGWNRLLAWELAYALQFVALEFFFRGFLVHGLKHRFGVYSVFVMTVPYCMIHFQKAVPECVASIVAGVALGLMSLKTRSVWLGAALHISVAWGMDACSLWRKGLLGGFIA